MLKDSPGARLARAAIGRSEDDAVVTMARAYREYVGEHPGVYAAGVHAANPDDVRLDSYAHLLYDQAVVAEGSKIADPAGFAKRINELLLKG